MAAKFVLAKLQKLNDNRKNFEAWACFFVAIGKQFSKKNWFLKMDKTKICWKKQKAKN